MKHLIEPPFCVVMFAVALSLASLAGPLVLWNLFHGRWLAAVSGAICLFVNGVTAGAQVFFIAKHVWRVSK